MIKTQVIGYLGKDCEVRQVGEQSVISFSVAHSEKYTDRNGQQVDKTVWVKCNIWRKPDKVKIADYLKKGTLVYVEGEPSANAYVNKEGAAAASLELRVTKLDFLGGKSSSTGVTDSAAPKGNGIAPPQNVEPEDDLPF